MKLPATRISILLLSILCLTLLPSVAAQTKSWGFNGNGELGIGNYTNAVLPQTVTTVPDATYINSGLYHTLFLKAGGSVHISGVNIYGTLGDGETQGEAPTPIPVAGMTNAVQVATNGYHSMVLKADGTVWAWGVNTYGQIGNGTFSSSGCFCAPSPVQTLISNVVQIDAGYNFSMALKADGTVWGWGTLTGNGTAAVNALPAQTGANVAEFNNIISISGGNAHALALGADGTVWSWGWNRSGQLGSGSSSQNEHRHLPARVNGLSGVTQIAAGEEHSVALKSDGTVWVWGRNDQGQIGNDTIFSGGCMCVPLPTQANITDVIDIKAEGYFTLARKRDGTVWAWGGNNYGQIGNGVTANAQRVPVQSMVGAGNALIGA
ncbi:MAG: hypothetical protein M3384_16010, partial [Acidobacteriota bacterium]|nr:hypothetical protein [Acidobacteriota bacterium]